MKAILSHDVDHITVQEHFLDGILLKHIIRSKIELFTGKISLNEFGFRIRELFTNKWNYVDEIMALHRSLNIQSTFFVGVNNALGLSYSKVIAQNMIQHIQSQGFETGVHGISFDNQPGIDQEHKLFEQFSGKKNFGMRMHYLRKNAQTLDMLSQAGYTFDSTDTGFKNPYKIGQMWEFPVQIMDTWELCGDSRFQQHNLKDAQVSTKKIIKEAQQHHLDFITIIFHDRYFNQGFSTWKQWYLWLLEYLKQENIEIINFESALKQVNNES